MTNKIITLCERDILTIHKTNKTEEPLNEGFLIEIKEGELVIRKFKLNFK